MMPLLLFLLYPQGSSEYNITVLIDQKDSERGLRAVHSRFYLSDTAIGVGIVGPGLIGATLIQQLKDQVRRRNNTLNKRLSIIC
jgi:aspartokinase/homoserine dehydrogenase 1